METGIFIQASILLLSLAIFFLLPKRANLAKTFLSRNRPSAAANRHFIAGAQLLSRARASKSKTNSHTLAKSASDHADQALSLNSRDPAAHILKAMAQSLMGHKTTAIKCLDAALAVPVVKMLSEKEKSDALVRRAEIRFEMGKRRGLDLAIEDLIESIELSPAEKSWCLLRKCYEVKGLREKAKEAFEQALKVDGGFKEAQEGLGRLGF